MILGYDATAAPNVNNHQPTANSSVLSNFRSNAEMSHIVSLLFNVEAELRYTDACQNGLNEITLIHSRLYCTRYENLASPVRL